MMMEVQDTQGAKQAQGGKDHTGNYVLGWNIKVLSWNLKYLVET